MTKAPGAPDRWLVTLTEVGYIPCRAGVTVLGPPAAQYIRMSCCMRG